jgi:uncharacterized protein
MRSSGSLFRLIPVYVGCILLGGAVVRGTKSTEFDWDVGNADKNWIRHRVSQVECEQVFFNRPLVAAEDVLHSSNEERFFALGHSDAGRLLFVVYTLRGEKIRVISARDMTRREQKEYELVRIQDLETGPAF